MSPATFLRAPEGSTNVSVTTLSKTDGGPPPSEVEDTAEDDMVRANMVELTARERIMLAKRRAMVDNQRCSGLVLVVEGHQSRRAHPHQSTHTDVRVVVGGVTVPACFAVLGV